MPLRFPQFRRGLTSILRGGLRYIFGTRGHRLVHGLRLLYRLRVLAILHTDPSFARLTRRTEVRLWVDGTESFSRLEKLLGRARHGIVIQMFIWKDDSVGRKIASILVDAANRGVQVDITKEAVGDFFEYNGDFLATKTSSNPVWQRFWNHRRIRISYATYNDHAKVYVIDDQILLLTGMNIAKEYRLSWHDYMVELRGSRFVEHYLTEGNLVEGASRGSVRLFMNTENRKEIRSAVRSLMASARHSIVLEQCYLSDSEIIDLLIRKSHQGVRITIIVPEAPDLHHHANMQAVGRLLMTGNEKMIRVFLFPGIVHGKVILVDRKTMFLGSANMIASSLDDMGEVCVLVEGKYRIALLKLREVLRSDILKSKPLTTPLQFRWVGRWLAWMGL